MGSVDKMATLDDDFEYRSRRTALRSELALLDGADQTHVVALFVREGHLGEFVVEGEIEPVGVFFRAVFCFVLIRLAETGVCDDRA